VDVELSIATETREAALLICSAGAQADRGDEFGAGARGCRDINPSGFLGVQAVELVEAAKEPHYRLAASQFGRRRFIKPLRAVRTEKQNPPACLVNVASFRERIWQGPSLHPSAGSERSICPNP
jgi:hypothetical protein